ncbi:uncharacterized protein [Diadema setosum]|uniref:uncharacterized protein n=1 Tax=Diadema setosum TaxID=31175 RepID=UPI003B3AF6EF
MPLQNPFSPSRLRRRLSRETLSIGKSSPDGLAKQVRNNSRLDKDGVAGSSPPRNRRDNTLAQRRKRLNLNDSPAGVADNPQNRQTSRKEQGRVKKKHEANVSDNRIERSPASSPARRKPQTPDVMSPALPYSKDFGTFDLTLCEANDGRCVVLVEYEDRVFLNGKQIYIMLNGTVTDREGKPSKTFQKYYDCALNEKRRIRSNRHSETPTNTKKAYNQARTSHQLRGSKRASKDTSSPGNDRTPSSTTRRESRYCAMKELADLETSFSGNIARLCQTVLEYVGREEAGTESGHEDDDLASEEISRQVQATLSRLIDQFQSVVDLSATLQERDDDDPDIDDDKIIEKLVEEAFSGGAKAAEKATEMKETKESAKISQSTKRRTVGTQIREGHKETRDKGEQTERKFLEETRGITAMREENGLLRDEIIAMENDITQMQALYQDLEKRYIAETEAKVEAMKQLQEMIDSDWREEAINSANRAEDVKEVAKVKIAEAKTEEPKAIPTNATYTLSSVSSVSIGSLSTVSSSDSECLPVADAKEPGQCMQLRTRALKSEIGRLRDVYSDVEDQLTRIANENSSLRLRVAKLTREAKEKQNQLAQANQSRENYLLEIKNLDSVNSQLEVKLAEVIKEKKFLSDKLKTVNEELSAMDVARRKAERESAEMQKTLSAIKEEKRQMSEELSRLEKAHLEESTKSAKLSKNTAENEVQLAIMRGQVGDMSVEVHQLRAENQANSDARQRAERDSRKLESDLRAARKMNVDLSAEVLQSKSTIGSLEDTVRHLEADISKLTQEVVHLEANKVALTQSLAEVKAGNQMLSDSNKELKLEKQLLKRKTLELHNTLEEMNKVNATIRSRLDNWDKDSADLGQRMKQIVGAKAELQDFIRQLNSVNANIERRFEKMDSEYENLERKLRCAGMGDEGTADDVAKA